MDSGMSDPSLKKAIIVLNIMLAFFMAGLLSNITSWSFLCSDPVTVEATVTDNRETYNSKGRAEYGTLYTYVPYVRYEVRGVQYDHVRVYGDMPRNSPAEVGSKITLTVDGRNPKKILGSPGWQTYLFASLTFFFLVFDILCIRESRNRKRNRF